MTLCVLSRCRPAIDNTEDQQNASLFTPNPTPKQRPLPTD